MGETEDAAGNTTLGTYAGEDITTGADNTALGTAALRHLTTGDRNTAVGKNAAHNINGDGDDNVFVGADAYNDPDTGRVVAQVTAVGAAAGYEASGDRTVYLGYAAGAKVSLDDTLVIDNRARGSEAAVLAEALIVGAFADDRMDQRLRVNAPLEILDGKVEMVGGVGPGGAMGNVTIGVGPFSVIAASATQGFSNTRIGFRAGQELTTGVGNTLIGENAGKDITTGVNNTAVGWDSQFALTTGTNNTSLGEDALKWVTGNGNTGVGYTAGYNITSGKDNSAFGPVSLYYLTVGDYNSAYGHNSGSGIVGDSNNNCFFGNFTYGASGGVVVNNSVAIGYAAGYNATGSRCVFIGASAGLTETNSDRLVVSNRAGGSDSALVYGVFHATPANQTLQINGKIYSPFPLAFKPGSSVTPANNGDITFELTSNTSLTVKAKGSDGVVRTAVLTLS